jgi:hypothetical protein
MKLGFTKPQNILNQESIELPTLVHPQESRGVWMYLAYEVGSSTDMGA